MDRYDHLYADASDAVTALMGAAFSAPAAATSNVTPLHARHA